MAPVGIVEKTKTKTHPNNNSLYSWLEGPCGLPQCCVRSWRLNPAVVLLIRAFVACSRVHMWYICTYVVEDRAGLSPAILWERPVVQSSCAGHRGNKDIKA